MFYLIMKKRTWVLQIGGCTWTVYSRKLQGYGGKQPVFHPFGSDRIMAARA